MAEAKGASNKAKKIKIEHACESCNATGLYIGFAEHDGAAVVCRGCDGTGKATHEFEYKEFAGKKVRKGVERVFQVNVGIGIGKGEKGEYKLEDFGGMPYQDWKAGKPFKPGMEDRKNVCPAWWYQTVDYTKRPNWNECRWGGIFSSCSSFKDKAKCWERWDKEFGKKGSK